MFRQAESPIALTTFALDRCAMADFADRLSEGAVGTGVPPFRSGFPAFAVRSSRVQSNGVTRHVKFP